MSSYEEFTDVASSENPGLNRKRFNTAAVQKWPRSGLLTLLYYKNDLSAALYDAAMAMILIVLQI
jgi:hypothetical protein